MSGGGVRVHHPIYIGTNPDEAVCHHHGEMCERKPVVKKGEHIHAAIDDVHLYECPECCLEAAAGAGKTDPGREESMRLMMVKIITDDWDDNLEKLFVDLGPGRMESGPDGKRGGVWFDSEPEDIADDLPEWLRERNTWFVDSEGGA